MIKIDAEGIKYEERFYPTPEWQLKPANNKILNKMLKAGYIYISEGCVIKEQGWDDGKNNVGYTIEHYDAIFLISKIGKQTFFSNMGVNNLFGGEDIVYMICLYLQGLHPRQEKVIGWPEPYCTKSQKNN
jgi:hypothetical protein